MKYAFRPTVLLLAVLSAACSRAPESDAQPSAPEISDAEIAAIVVAANEVDAELGEIAGARATDPAVREFGRTMTRDHRAVNEQAGALVGRLGVTPVESEVSRKLRADAEAFRSELDGLSGSEFDRAYMAREVAYHQGVLGAVDQLLVPSAQNAELRQMLIDVRPAFVAHLQHAEHLNERLK